MTCECRQTHRLAYTHRIEKINAFKAAYVFNTKRPYLDFTSALEKAVGFFFMQVNVQRSLQIQLRVYCFYLFDQMRILLIQICNSAVAHKHMYAHEDWCEIIYSARTIHEI